LRTPLLPFTQYLQWADGLKAPHAWENGETLQQAISEDKEKLRAALRDMIRRPEIREALYLASPTLDQSLEYWLRDPESERGRGAELVLVRYFQRMTQRCTPFGLFAGHTLGRMGVETRLELGPWSAVHRRTRLDRGYLGQLVYHYSASVELRNTLTFLPNSSLYHAAGRLRYTEFTVNEQGRRQYRLVAVAESAHLLTTLARTRAGAKIAVLAQALADDEGVTLAEAESFVHELIDSQILVSDLEPNVTGPDSAREMAHYLANCPATAESGRRLLATTTEIGEIDRTGMGHSPERYRALGKELESLPVPVDLSKFLQVDLFRHAPDAMLGPEVAREIEQCTAILRRIAPRPRPDPLTRFKQAFQRRYEQRWVTLMEALDPETGIGLPIDTRHPAADAPLLKDFLLGDDADGDGNAGMEWSARDVHLFRRVQELAARQVYEWVLSEEDLRALQENTQALPLADSAAAFAVLAARSAEAVANGDFRVYFRHGSGPSGARLLSRFCHGDPELHARTLAHLRREEEYRPDVVFAEIVFLSQSRAGNVLARPVLRGHEIVFLGRSGAEPAQRIPVSDLLVSVVDNRVVLYSGTLGKEIIPRLTSAANYVEVLALYEFLGLLQGQGTAGQLSWRWGQIAKERFLPRVSCGRGVLARAQWAVEASEIKPMLDAVGAERFRRLQWWRRERRLPRFCLLLDEDNELLVDLDNTLSVETFCDLIKKRLSFILAENFPGPEDLAVDGPDGRYTHELVVPLLRVRDEKETQRALLHPPGHRNDRLAENLMPGSEWLFFKLYGGEGTADLILVETIAAAMANLKARGVVDRWFFIRYDDPDPHLRVRLHGDPARLCAEALPEMYRWLNPLVESGRLWRIELGSYQRETERYGGPENIVRAEQLFELDSAAVLDILRDCPGDEGATYRWQLALAGADRWLRDFGFDLAARHQLVRRARDAYVQEFRAEGKNTQGWFADRFRKERKTIETLIGEGRVPEALPLQAGLEVLARRSRQSAPLIQEIRSLHAQGGLSVSLEDLSHSLIHMFINRVLRSAQRAQELVIYEFLVRLYGSEVARSSAPGTPRPVHKRLGDQRA
jgi:lantibiotic biosynthesis protein